MKLSPIYYLPAILLPFLLTACANTTQVALRYKDTSRLTPIHTLLIAAKTPENHYRIVWETACAKVFATLPLKIRLSHKVLPDWHDASLEPLTHWETKHHADAILLGDITSLLLAPPQMPAANNNTVGFERAPDEDPIGVPDWSFFIGKKAKKKAQPPRFHKVEAQLLTQKGHMLWDAILTTHEANDLKAIAHSQCKAVKNALVSHHLLQKR